MLRNIYPEVGAGGFTRYSGTPQFWLRVQMLAEPDMTVLSFGAGRGGAQESPLRMTRELTNLRGKVARVIGADIDEAVRDNPTLDEAIVFDGKTLPLPDASVDLIVSDHVFEHLDDPQAVASELARVLKPGGWLCARTPYLYSLLALGSSLVPNRLHARLLHKVQPGFRAAHDVFPTRYRLNSMRALKRYFPGWENCSYTWSPEPAYHFGSVLLVRLLAAVQYLKRPFGGEVLMVFLRKPVSG
jgi:SAM-dependent methyltransferase